MRDTSIVRAHIPCDTIFMATRMPLVSPSSPKAGHCGKSRSRPCACSTAICPVRAAAFSVCFRIAFSAWGSPITMNPKGGRHLLHASLGDRRRPAEDSGLRPRLPFSPLRELVEDGGTPRPFVARLQLGPDGPGFRAGAGFLRHPRAHAAARDMKLFGPPQVRRPKTCKPLTPGTSNL